MILQPRKFKFKSIQKNRITKYSKKKNVLRFGNTGLIIKRSLLLRSKQMAKFRIFLKKATKKVDKTLRLAWVNFYPHLPLTRKPKQSRMGKGKGKRKTWYIHLQPGMTILEFRNLRLGRSLYFFKIFTTKLAVPTHILFSSYKFLKSPMLHKQNNRLKAFW